MTIPITLTMWLVAALPIIVILVLMLKFGWGVAEAGAIAVLIAFFSAACVFRADLVLLASESAKGIWSAFFVLIIVWPAILIFEVTDGAKAFEVIQGGMEKYTPNELLKVLAFGWVFAGFFQGITGFGVPVAVCAPLLVGMGVAPVWAVVIPLLGHAWANTFGTLAVAWQALLDQTGITGESLLHTAFWAAAFLWIFNFLSGMVLCWFYGKKDGLRTGFLAVAIISLIQGGGQLALSQINQTIAAFIPTSLALIAIFLIGRTKKYGREWRLENSRIMIRKGKGDTGEETLHGLKLSEAFVPYFVLAALTIIVLLIKPINRMLGQVKIGLPFSETATGYEIVNSAVGAYSSFSPFIHSGTLLFVAAMIGYFFFKSKGRFLPGEGRKIFIKTVEKTVPSTIAVSELLIMSKIMSGTGQTLILAHGTAEIMGDFYALLAPAVGLLGAFITSSNMASNILFAQFQQITANFLGMAQEPFLGAQTAGGAIGNTVAPGNVILGTTTAGILGSEGKVLKKIFPTALTSVALCGFILWLKLVIFG